MSEYDGSGIPTGYESLQARIEEARKVVAQVPLLPDVGKHGDDCYLRHRDCLVAKLDRILAGGCHG